MSPGPDSGVLEERLSPEELRETWPLLSPEDRVMGMKMLPYAEAEEFFFNLAADEQAQVITARPVEERRAWMRMLPPDDAADVVQAAEESERESLLALLDEKTRHEVQALLAYAEDQAGGLMNTRYARVRPDMTADEAISYLRKQAREYLETITYIYVLDDQQHLLGVIALRELFSANPETRVRDIMKTDVVTVTEDQDQEAVSRLFADYSFVAIPVVDAGGCMKGVVTLDDIVDVVQEEATEDIQKIGGMQALEAPYMQVGLAEMIRKRGVWLAVLLVGEMLTATAMTYYEEEIARAVVLAVFVPLIISSGGNSGSQATTLVIRAMALGEVRLRDWWRVTQREFAAGAAMGAILGVLGFLRIVLWQAVSPIYGPHYLYIAIAVAGSLAGVVLFGTIAGSLLPFLLRRLRLDPASASAPFVATLVDVMGIVIYFSLATWILRGRLL